MSPQNAFPLSEGSKLCASEESRSCCGSSVLCADHVRQLDSRDWYGEWKFPGSGKSKLGAKVKKRDPSLRSMFPRNRHLC